MEFSLICVCSLVIILPQGEKIAFSTRPCLFQHLCRFLNHIQLSEWIMRTLRTKKKEGIDRAG